MRDHLRAQAQGTPRQHQHHPTPGCGSTDPRSSHHLTTDAGEEDGSHPAEPCQHPGPRLSMERQHSHPPIIRPRTPDTRSETLTSLTYVLRASFAHDLRTALHVLCSRIVQHPALQPCWTVQGRRPPTLGTGADVSSQTVTLRLVHTRTQSPPDGTRCSFSPPAGRATPEPPRSQETW